MSSRVEMKRFGLSVEQQHHLCRRSNQDPNKLSPRSQGRRWNLIRNWTSAEPLASAFNCRWCFQDGAIMRVISSLSWQTKDGELQHAVIVMTCNNRTPQPTTQRKRIWIYLSGPRRMLLDGKQARKRSRMIAPRLAICIQFWVFSIAIVLLPLFHSAGNFVFSSLRRLKIVLH